MSHGKHQKHLAFCFAFVLLASRVTWTLYNWCVSSTSAEKHHANSHPKEARSGVSATSRQRRITRTLIPRKLMCSCMCVCGCAVGGGHVLLLAWTVDLPCVLYMMRITGSVVGLAVVVFGFFVGVLHIIIKETCLMYGNLSYLCTYLYICHVVVLRVTLSNVYAVERQISIVS